MPLGRLTAFRGMGVIDTFSRHVWDDEHGAGVPISSYMLCCFVARSSSRKPTSF